MAPLYLHGEQDRQGWCERDSEHVQFPRTELQHPLLPHLHHDRLPAVSLPGPGRPEVLRLLQVSHCEDSGEHQITGPPGSPLSLSAGPDVSLFLPAFLRHRGQDRQDGATELSAGMQTSS